MEGGSYDPVSSASDRDSEEGRAGLDSLDVLLPGRNVQETQSRQAGAERRRASLKRSWVPGWAAQASRFVKREIFGMDMDDTEKCGLLDEQRVTRRAGNRKLAFFLAVPVLLLVAYGAWAVGSGANQASVAAWRQSLFQGRGEHAERQTTTQQYLVGVGKADITG